MNSVGTSKSLDLSRRTNESVNFCQNFRQEELLEGPISRQNPDEIKSKERTREECATLLNNPNVSNGLEAKLFPVMEKTFFALISLKKLFPVMWSHGSNGGSEVEKNQFSAKDKAKFVEQIHSLKERIKIFVDTVEDSNPIFIDRDKHFDLEPIIDISKLLGLDSLDDDLTSTQVSELIEGMSNRVFRKEIEALGEHFTSWAFDRALPNLTHQSKQLRRALESGSEIGISGALVDMELVASRLHRINDAFAELVYKTEISIKHILSNATNIRSRKLPGLKTLLQEFEYIRGVIHDIRNFFSYASNIIELYSILPEDEIITELLNAIDELDLKKLDNNIRVAAMLHHSDANKKGVKLTVSNTIPEATYIPTDVSRLIFRTVSELTLNAIKYADMGKNSRWIRVKAVKSENLLDIIVEDNGVGIKDVKKVLMHGERERPDLAEGTGTGLAALSQVAEKMKLKLSVESKPGTGSKITLKGINIGDSRTPPTSGSVEGGGAKPTPAGSKEMENSSFNSFLSEAETATLYEPILLEEDLVEQSLDIYMGQSLPINPLNFIMGAGVFATQPARAGH